MRPRPVRAQPGAQHAAVLPRRVRGPRLESACPAGACTGLRVFDIDPELCKGCALCAKKCPTDAILGKRKIAHYIIVDHCIGCGACADCLPQAGRAGRRPERNDHEASPSTAKRSRRPRGETVLKVARRAGVDIPHLCSLDWAPSPAASCRMCVVEVEGNPRLLTSCTLEATDGMTVQTHTPRVLKARRAIMELLLASHPHDCLYCVRSGDCELATWPASWACAGGATSAPSSSTRWTSAPRRCARSQQVHPVRPLRHRLPRRAGRRRHRLHRTRVQDPVAPGFAVGLNVERVRLLRPVRPRLPDGRHRRA